MNDDHSLLSREIRGPTFDRLPIFLCCHDDFFAYITDDSALEFIDASSRVLVPTQRRIQLTEKSLPGTILALAVNPAHTIAVLAFDEGTLGADDLVQCKHFKNYSFQRNPITTHIAFLSDGNLIKADETLAITYQNIVNLSIRLLTQAMKHVPSSLSKDVTPFRVSDKIIEIVIPPVRRGPDSPSGDSSRSLTDSFDQMFAVITEAAVEMCSYDGGQTQRLWSVPSPMAQVGFFLANSRNLFMAVASKTQLQVLSLQKGSPPAALYTRSISHPIHLVAFLLQSVVMLVYQDYSCSIISFVEGSELQTVLRLQGQYLQGPRVVADHKLWAVQLIPFASLMEQSRKSRDFEAAIVLCRNAILGRPTATVGLPLNTHQRAHIIERELSTLLRQYTEERLAQPELAESTIDYLLSLAQEFRMKGWIVTDALTIFRNAGLLSIYFRKVIQNDPMAMAFRYPRAFATLLLENCEGLDIHDFLLNLSSKTAPVEMLLKFGLDTGRTHFLFGVYTTKLDDFISGIAVLANGNDYARISVIMSSALEKDRFLELATWFLAPTESYVYPRLMKLLDLADPHLFVILGNFIKANDRPVTFCTYANIVISTLHHADVPRFGPFFDVVKQYVRDSDVKLGNTALQYVLPYIFSPSIEGEEDDRESLLITILNGGLEAELLKNLIPLCDTYRFSNAKKYIQITGKKYDSFVRDSLLHENSDVSRFIVRQLRSGCVASEFKEAIISNARLLISKDVNSFIKLVCTNFTDFHADILSSLDGATRQYYLHSIVQSEFKDVLELDKSVMRDYVGFLCESFPGEVCQFMQSHPHFSFFEFLPICSQFGIFDACAWLTSRVTPSEQCYKYMSDYLSSRLLAFGDGRTETLDLSFLFALLREVKFEEFVELLGWLIRGAVFPTYSVLGDEVRLNQVCSVLRELCSLLVDHIPFTDVLKILIREFADFPLGSQDSIRSILRAILNDIEYDTEATSSLANVFREHESSATDEFFEAAIRGIGFKELLCGTCHAPMNGSPVEVCFFNCGHGFHYVDACLSSQICPICNELEHRMDAEPPVTTLSAFEASMKLGKFERFFRSGTQGNETAEIEIKATIAVVKRPFA
jgi:hypothetical protein